MTKTKLSILICTLEGRRETFDRLFAYLDEQRANRRNEVEILVDCDNGELTTGTKRNNLLERATGEYVCFVDDDDWVCPDYVDLLLYGIAQGTDCMSLRGEYLVDGVLDGIFEHSIKYRAYRTTDNAVKYERYPNHLNAIRASIAKQFKFPAKTFGEDTDWATQIFNSRLIKTEHEINETIYYYRYTSKK